MWNAALAELYDDLDRDIMDNLAEDMAAGFVTKNSGRDGHDYIWFFDGTINEAIDVVTSEIVTDEEKLDRLFG